MPLVGMRRTTRVFGVRVLRSGRRVWTGSVQRKHMKVTNGELWIDLLETSVGGGGGDALDYKGNGWEPNGALENEEVIDMDIEAKAAVESESDKLGNDGSVVDNSVGRMFVNVYTRKRKKGDSNCGEKTSTLEDKMCGKTYSRKVWSKRRTKKIRLCEIADACDRTDLAKTLKIVVQSCCGMRYAVVGLLNSLLRYMRNTRVEPNQLFAFFNSKSVSQVYSSCGIHFLQGSSFSLERGVCMIMGGSRSIPAFALDFSAVPFCFMYLHLSILLRGIRLSSMIGARVMGIEENEDIEEKDDDVIICISSEMTPSADVSLIPSICNSGGKTRVSYVNSGAAKSASRNIQVRNSRNIQKRSSLRSKRGRPHLSLNARKFNGATPSNMFGVRQNSLRLPSFAPGRELRSSAQRSNLTSMKQVKSALLGFRRDADATTCFANILVMESDRCFREQGAVIALEVSAKKQWYLAVKTGGIKRYSVVADKFMRPCSCNRFTHAIIWAENGGWKLEFPDRRDWFIFKELYKECSVRNERVLVESCIPIPGVQEVPLCDDINVGFARPASYIKVSDAELARALTRRAANYDMDSDDEEWLCEFNKEFSAENDNQKILSDEIFELTIDAFERGFHCNPDDYSDETAVPNIVLNVEKRILEAVYSYWIKKRKQKRSALVRVFQFYEPRRTELIPKSVLRKKRSNRSFKRWGSQAGRGKQRFYLHAMAAEHEAEETRTGIFELEEAKAAARSSMESAILKRERAQLLMQNADLLTYKATMALKIADLARLRDVDLAEDADSARDALAIVPFFSGE